MINNDVRKALIDAYPNFKDDDEIMVVAHWGSPGGLYDHWGLSINPNRPTVVYGFVKLDESMGGYLEYGTWWVEEEPGNPYSVGNTIAEVCRMPHTNDGSKGMSLMYLDEAWQPVRLSVLKKRMGWK